MSWTLAELRRTLEYFPELLLGARPHRRLARVTRRRDRRTPWEYVAAGRLADLERALAELRDRMLFQALWTVYLDVALRDLPQSVRLASVASEYGLMFSEASALLRRAERSLLDLLNGEQQS